VQHHVAGAPQSDDLAVVTIQWHAVQHTHAAAPATESVTEQGMT
jgi:hypothetical protein